MSNISFLNFLLLVFVAAKKQYFKACYCIFHFYFMFKTKTQTKITNQDSSNVEEFWNFDIPKSVITNAAKNYFCHYCHFYVYYCCQCMMH